MNPRCKCGAFIRRPVLLPPYDDVRFGYETGAQCGKCRRYVIFWRGRYSLTTTTNFWPLPSWGGWYLGVA